MHSNSGVQEAFEACEEIHQQSVEGRDKAATSHAKTRKSLGQSGAQLAKRLRAAATTTPPE